MSYATSSHYTLYWTITPEQRRDLSAFGSVNSVASDQLAKVKPGDVLWMVNVYLNHLLLLGRLHVETVVSDSAVAQDLIETSDRWIDADWYAIANRYNVESMREVDVTYLAQQLRFRSRFDRLDVSDGRIDAKQLLPLRELTPDSAQLLERAWYDERYEPQSIQDYLELTEDDQAYAEGKIVVRTVKQRQRSRTLVLTAKEQFKASYGHLYCEVCGFDFAEVYGIDYIEAHHKEAVASLDESHQSSPEDLVMLCANCHRIVHTRTPPLTIEELKALLNTN